MSGRVEERQLGAARGCDLIGADMLGDATGLARDNLGIADRVEQRGLAVVHVAHDGDHGGARLQVFVLVRNCVNHILDIRIADADDLVTEFLDDEFGGIGVDGLVLGDHHAIVHQRLDHIADTFGHTVGQFADNDGFRKLHVADNLFALLRTAHGLLPGAFLLALHRGHGFLTTAFATGKCLIQRQFSATATAIVTALATTFAIVAVGAFGLARRLFDGAVLLGARLVGRRGRSRGLFGRGFGLALFAGLFLGLGFGAFLGLALFAFLGLGLFAAALTLCVAGFFLGFALGGFFDLTFLGRGQGFHAAFHFGVRNASRPARGIR